MGEIDFGDFLLRNAWIIKPTWFDHIAANSRSTLFGAANGRVEHGTVFVRLRSSRFDRSYPILESIDGNFARKVEV